MCQFLFNLYFSKPIGYLDVATLMLNCAYNTLISMHRVIVLGAGLVGNVIARDLHKDDSIVVVVADINKERLDYLHQAYGLSVIQLDLGKERELEEIIKDFDLVIGAVPGFMGFETLERVIKCGKNIVDISFFEEDPFQLDDLAKRHGVTAIIDAGVAPGLSNLIAGYEFNSLDEMSEFECYVGGLPKERVLPFEYKAPFSPVDVIEEYTRDARMVEDGRIVVKPALSEPEILYFQGIGSLEAFNTDGLRTLLKTLKVPFMKEKTLRYPGHIEKIKLLKDAGFLSTKPIRIGETEITPIEFTSKILIDNWKLKKGEEDFTVMRVIVRGKKQGENLTITYELYDEYDREEEVLSMARTTGFTCTAIARLVLSGKIKQKGIIPPEKIGMNADVFRRIIEELRKRKIALHVIERKEE